ncbi:RagB/SusD family nutrient uptake outer membrane protein [Solitalea lacus]|uniref:RagB/SusD family nutrient uptake outer membrane protein n=1 Tax=Solitalea lacus TaxID=2911172 RepID=UPI001EDA82D3|nr:RagB/SusD family nutrient uptake outer membrane protein [Solitalea lacus]UKJ09272.1 RagB/SusD family nutrient uptake outer membrane protein [Solitalea lacus]
MLKSGIMQVVRKKILVMAGLCVLFSTVACQKWVDDAPQPLQVDESKVFSTEQGFRDALNGVYLQLGSSALYGRELTMGVLSLAGRNYDSVSVTKVSNLYYKAATCNLADPSVKSYSAEVWNKMYQSIANLNNVLANAETRKGIFTGDNYKTVKGEALALRAYLHFDLLRLFAPAPVTGQLASPAIPYVTALSANATPVSSVEQVLQNCIADLTAADELLSADDLTASQFTKWAVKGLLARVYMYKGDNAQAKENALAVINSNKFSLSTNNNDLFFTKESLFKLYIYNNNYYAYYKSVFSSPVLLGLSSSAQTAVYVTGNGATSDYRKNFINTLTGNGTGAALMPKKFYATASNIFPMIRLSEMYYIAAECAADVPTGLSYINQVRTGRGVPALTAANVPDAGSLSNEIMKEYRKEFIGEGQMFFYYKRKNTPFTALPFYPKVPAVAGEAYVPVAANASYTFIKPE